MTDSAVYDCTQCGACCQCFPIYASEADGNNEQSIKLESRLLRRHMRKEDRMYKLFPLPFLNQCPFLKTDQLCRIYETRPKVCRQFEAGSPQCIEARERIGISD